MVGGTRSRTNATCACALIAGALGFGACALGHRVPTYDALAAGDMERPEHVEPFGFDASNAMDMPIVSADESVPEDLGVDAVEAGDAGLDVLPTDVALEAGDAGLDVLRTDAALEAGADVMVSYRTDPSDLRELPWHGEEALWDHKLRCDDGEVAVGLVGRTSGDRTLINALGVRCARLEADGTLGASRVVGPQGGLGVHDFDERCPAGQLIVRLVGRAGATIDRVGAVCAPVAAWLDATTFGAALTEYGGTGGSVFADTCPANYVGLGVDIEVGWFDWWDRVRRVHLVCVRVTR